MTTASRSLPSNRSSMSVYTSGIPKRCASAPAPTTPMRTGSVMSSVSGRRTEERTGSVDRSHGRAGIVGAEDGAEVLAGARPSDRAGLTHTDAVPVAAAMERQRLHHAALPHHRVDRKIRAV